MRVFLTLGLTASVLCGACNNSEPQTAVKAADPAGVAAGVDYAVVASQLVTRSLGAKPGDHVLITGSPAELQLLEDLAVEVRKAGAWPVITVTSERLTKRSYDAVPAERDGDAPTVNVALARAFPSTIVVEGSSSAAVLRHVSAERIATRARAAQPLVEQLDQLNKATVFLGNGVFPSEENARLHGMTLADFNTLFWAGVNADPATLAATGNAVRAVLRGGKQVQIKTVVGTDLTLSLHGLEPYISDGAITGEEIKRGHGAQNVWLPAGEVFVRVDPGSANGTIVAERVLWEGEVVEGLRLEVRNGRVTALSATAGLDRLKTSYDAATAGKDILSIFDVGVNKAMTIPAESRFVSFMPAGIITLFLGTDTWAGGSNTSTFGLPLFLKGATVTVDGVPLVTNGALQTGS